MRSNNPPAHMIEREDILTEINGELQALQSSDDAQLQIVNYYGLTGVGKSFVILNIFHKYKHNYPIIWLDFDIKQASRRESIHNWHDIRNVLSHIPALRFIPDAIKFSNYEKRPLSSKEVLFRAENLELCSQKPLILLLDHLDDVDYWQWIQASVLQPLIGKQHAITICMSQTMRLPWHSVSLDARHSTREVHPFSREETRLLLQQFGLELFAKLAQDVTQGYPLRLFYLLQLLEQEGRFREHVAPIPIDRLQTQLSKETFDIISYIGLIRRFDINITNKVLGEFFDDWKAPSNHHQILSQVYSELQPYIEPYRRGQPYQLVPELRYAVEGWLQKRDRSLYVNICNRLASNYAQQFRRDPQRNTNAFLDWAYFSSNALLFENSNHEEWLTSAQQLLTHARSLGIRLAFWLYKDGELVGKLQELKLFTPLVDIIRTHIGDNEVGNVLDETEFSTYSQWVIERIGQQESLSYLHDTLNLMNLLLTIDSLGNDFDPKELYNQLNKADQSLNRIHLNLALQQLRSSGLVEESDKPDRLMLPKAVRTLVKAPSAFR